MRPPQRKATSTVRAGTSDRTAREGATGLRVPSFSKDLTAQPSLRVREAPDTRASACQVGFFVVVVQVTECRKAM